MRRANQHRWKLGAAALLAASMTVAVRAEIIDRIAVSVGNRVITESDLNREIRVTAFQNRTQPDFSPRARRATAERMIDQKLIAREVETSRYPTPSPSEAESMLQDFKQRENFKDDAEFRKALQAAGITVDDLKARLLWESTFLMFTEDRFSRGVQISSQEIQDYFEKVVRPAALAANPGQPAEIDEYRDRIEYALTGMKVDSELERWLAETRKRTEIVYRDEVFE